MSGLAIRYQKGGQEVFHNYKVFHMLGEKNFCSLISNAYTPTTFDNAIKWLPLYWDCGIKY